MIVIKEFPSKKKCDVRRCMHLNVYSIGDENEHPMFKQFFCKDHLLEIAEAVNTTFGDDTEQKEAEEQALLSELKETNAKLRASLENFNPTEDIETLKAELASAKATSELFKENIDTLTAENNKLKQAANKHTPTKKKK